MFKKITLLNLVLFLLFVNVKAQEANSENTENQLNQLKNKIQAQQKLIQKNAELLKYQESKIADMGTKMSAEIASLKNEQALQLQAIESKMTGILDGYTAKIDTQNKAIEDLKASLNKKDFNLYIYIAIALGIALVLFVYFMKIATQKAITQQGKNWSDFLTHIVKR